MLVILFLVSIEGTLHVNDSPPHHQILKADVGQDVTFSCHFDEEKLDQVRRVLGGDLIERTNQERATVVSESDRRAGHDLLVHFPSLRFSQSDEETSCVCFIN